MRRFLKWFATLRTSLDNRNCRTRHQKGPPIHLPKSTPICGSFHQISIAFFSSWHTVLAWWSSPPTEAGAFWQWVKAARSAYTNSFRALGKLNMGSCLPSRHRRASSHHLTPYTSANLILVSGMRGLPPGSQETIYFPINYPLQGGRKRTGITASLLQTKQPSLQRRV